jgi:DNA excision repair protein ERCC-4
VTIQIVVDDREQPSGILDVLARMQDVAITVQRLSIGDYIIDDKIIFERKTLADFAISIIDGRLFKQIYRFPTSRYKYALIIEGDRKAAEALRVTREAIQGALITVSLIYGIPILRSKDITETALLMLYAAKQVHAITVGSLMRKGRKPKSKRKLQLHILQGLPSVGIYRATQLLQTFGCIENVINADLNALKTVRGINETTAKKILWAVRAHALKI